MAYTLQQFINLELSRSHESPNSASTPPAPPAAHTLSRNDRGIELNDLNRNETWGSLPSLRDPGGLISDQSTAVQTPKTATGTQTPNDLEESRPATPLQHDATGVVPSFWFPKMNRWRVLCVCLTYMGNGMNDSAPGALIPYIEKDYEIGYAIVSLIFVTTAAGFISAAFVTDSIQKRTGRAKALMISELGSVIGCSILICTPPFPVVVLAFFIIGHGVAINLAMNNVFAANMSGATIMLGISHGSYGIGGLVAPIIATTLVSRGILWSRFYIILLGVRLLSLLFNGWTNWNYEKDTASLQHAATQPMVRQRAASEGEQQSAFKLVRQALKNRTTIMGALFIFCYQGAEVSISGWVISFLINYRGGDPSKVGYVTSGFWGGITLGRFALVHLAPRVGERRLIHGLGLGAIAFELLVWFVPNVIGDAVAVALVGLLLGPIYPCAQTVFNQLLPRRLQTSAIGFISSAGSSGGAVAPFTTGLMAQALGTVVLHPIAIALFAVMLLCLLGLPRGRKPTD